MLSFILKFSLWFFVAAYLFHIATKKYLNPYKLTMVFGKKGSGKSRRSLVSYSPWGH